MMSSDAVAVVTPLNWIFVERSSLKKPRRQNVVEKIVCCHISPIIREMMSGWKKKQQQQQHSSWCHYINPYYALYLISFACVQCDNPRTSISSRVKHDSTWSECRKWALKSHFQALGRHNGRRVYFQRKIVQRICKYVAFWNKVP